MKFIKKLRKNSSLKVLILIIAMISCIFVSSSCVFLANLSDYNSIANDQREVDNETMNPIASPSDFDDATKIITKGSQQGA